MAKEKNVYLSKLAEQAERYDEMAEYMKLVAEAREERRAERRPGVVGDLGVGAHRAQHRQRQAAHLDPHVLVGGARRLEQRGGGGGLARLPLEVLLLEALEQREHDGVARRARDPRKCLGRLTEREDVALQELHNAR